MGITDWLNKKREERVQDAQIRAIGKSQAQEEANIILERRKKLAEEEAAQAEINRRTQLLEQAKQDEIEKLTTSKREKFQKGIQKVEEGFSKFSGKLEQVGGKLSQGTSQLGRGVSGSLDSKVDFSSQVKPKKKTARDLISTDNTNTPWGNKVFGNTFTQDKKLVGGFSSRQLTDSEKIKKFLK